MHERTVKVQGTCSAVVLFFLSNDGRFLKTSIWKCVVLHHLTLFPWYERCCFRCCEEKTPFVKFGYRTEGDELIIKQNFKGFLDWNLDNKCSKWKALKIPILPKSLKRRGLVYFVLSTFRNMEMSFHYCYNTCNHSNGFFLITGYQFYR